MCGNQVVDTQSFTIFLIIFLITGSSLTTTFQISRSLSKKGCLYDNAVAEATFKIIKTEFVKNERFETLDELKLKLADYVNWFNNHKIIHLQATYTSSI